MKRFFFIGIERSLTAKVNDWTWKDGHLAAKQLFDVLKFLNIDPLKDCLWGNISDKNIFQRIGMFYRNSSTGLVVAMGSYVDGILKQRNLLHTSIYHPAARGKIRRKANYLRHVKSRLPVKTMGL